MIASSAASPFSPISLLRARPQSDLRRAPAAAPPPRRPRSPVCKPISAASCAEKEYTYYTYTSARLGAAPLAVGPSPAPSLYDVLGVTAGATCAEIKLAYRRLARECHPDVVEVDRRETSADRFMRVHAAYATLSDPQKRAEYDRELHLLLLRSRRPAYASPQVTASTLSGFRRRTWETDQCW